jgi:uncharacterized small protein (DUF1192 family)
MYMGLLRNAATHPTFDYKLNTGYTAQQALDLADAMLLLFNTPSATDVQMNALIVQAQGMLVVNWEKFSSTLDALYEIRREILDGTQVTFTEQSWAAYAALRTDIEDAIIAIAGQNSGIERLSDLIIWVNNYINALTIARENAELSLGFLTAQFELLAENYAIQIQTMTDFFTQIIGEVSSASAIRIGELLAELDGLQAELDEALGALPHFEQEEIQAVYDAIHQMLEQTGVLADMGEDAGVTLGDLTAEYILRVDAMKAAITALDAEVARLNAELANIRGTSSNIGESPMTIAIIAGLGAAFFGMSAVAIFFWRGKVKAVSKTVKRK